MTSCLKIVSYVAIHLEDEKETPPYIAKVVTMPQDGSNIEIHWMKGGWRSPWKPMFNGRKPYYQWVAVGSVILFDIGFNALKCLTSDSIKSFKAKYIWVTK